MLVVVVVLSSLEVFTILGYFSTLASQAREGLYQL